LAKKKRKQIFLLALLFTRSAHDLLVHDT